MMYKQRTMQLDNALEDAAMATLVANYTEDVKEGTAAFHEKRKPSFKGRNERLASTRVGRAGDDDAGEIAWRSPMPGSGKCGSAITRLR